jgi:opacity protein-like surface antigen
MVRATFLALAGAASLLSTAALAADLPPPLPPPVFRAPVVVETGGWYLRGDVGVGMQQYKSFDFTQTNVGVGGVWPASWRIDVKDIKDTFFIGGGIGYSWNNWLRFDVTAEYRADVKFKAVGSYTEFCASGRCFDAYDGDHAAIVGLVNAYLDLGTWWCLTPFIGAGVGGAYHRTDALTDVGYGLAPGNFPISVLGYANTEHTNWSFAWALHAGVAYTVTPNFKVEFAYRYLNMGNAQTSEVLCGGSGCGTGTGPRAYYTLTDFDSQDFRIGVRWMLQPDAPPPIYPLMRKG